MRRSIYALVALLACGGPKREAEPPPRVLAVDAGKKEEGVIGARWVLDFSDSSAVKRIPLEGGGTLVVGDGGERWITKDGAVTSATSLLPEPPLTAKKVPEGFRFIGRKTGAFYVAREPLGVVTKTSKGLDDAQTLASGKEAVLAINRKGELMRSVDGSTWTKITLPRDPVVARVATHDADGLVATVPQQLFATKDDGATWALVRSPPIRLRSISSAEDGVYVTGDTYYDRYRLDAAFFTFMRGAGPRRDQPSANNEPSVDLDRRQRLVDGPNALELFVDDTGERRVWTLASGRMAAPLERRVVPELTRCEYVSGDRLGDTIMLACDMEGTSKGASSWVTKLFTSADGGKTFKLETTLEGGRPDEDLLDTPIAIGPGGFVYLGRRCPDDGECVSARVRVSSDATWRATGTEIINKKRKVVMLDHSEGDDDDYDAPPRARYRDEDGQVITRHIRFARSSAGVFSIGLKDGEGQLYAWKSGAPQPLTSLGYDVESYDATLSVDDDGTLRGFVRDGARAARTYEWKPGLGNPRYYPLPEDAVAAFAGKRGFAVGLDAHESVDGGRTWTTLSVPSSVTTVTGCSSEGCATDGGYRVGWAGPGVNDAIAKAPPKPQYAKPLRCTATGSWTPVGRGALPNVNEAAHGPYRWVLPVRADKKVMLVSNKRGEPATRTTSALLLDTPPASATSTAVRTYVQKSGVVAVRYAAQSAPAPKIVTVAGKQKLIKPAAPWDVSLAWVRDANASKVLKGTAPSLTMSTSAARDGDFDDDLRPDLPDFVTLGPSGVWFHPPVRDDQTVIPLYNVRDDGKTDSAPFVLARESGQGTLAIDSGLALTSGLRSGNVTDGAWTAFTGTTRVPYSLTVGLASSDAAAAPFEMNGKTLFAITTRGPGWPARAFALAINADGTLGSFSTLPTQKTFGDVPRACDAAALADPKAADFIAPWVTGARHPVVVDIDAVAQVLATDAAKVRLSGASSCVSAMDAKNATLTALIYPDDLTSGVIFRRGAQIEARALECSFVSGPLPSELQSTPGFASEAR